MASIIKHPNGRKATQFKAPNGKRPKVSLGKVPLRTAQTVKGHVEQLVSAAITGQAPPDETSKWIARLNKPMLDKLANVGLTAQRGTTRLGEFLGEYLARRNDVKPATKTNWGHTKRNLIAFFGAEKPLGKITAGDAKDFERYLKGTARENRYADKEKDDGPSPDTVRKRIGNAKQFFDDAVDRELLTKTPFAGLSSAQHGNKAREFTITPEMAVKVLEACPPNSEWPLIFALCRYGRLRCSGGPDSLHDWGSF